ncbi:hypothetical protein JAAARDRAFT_58159 [Jaapia argillacea MUCL 33604]|uniref:Uncharacterized protein n=1 Tax=Jaapia argillacea MUCL 33604 TaxID=933084 RepID=A0A067Q4N9_9AGAM|nr:hypothetical protein JAAARDRAFT_58159 [Jaapia argillacea MUCL 33604]
MAPPSLKRKLEEDLSSEAGTPVSYASKSLPMRTKRRRWDSLEGGFAGLTINHIPYFSSPSPTVESPSDGSVPFSPSAQSVPSLDVHTTTEFDTLNSPHRTTVQPTSVEEPPSPDLGDDIKMKGTSWYEPEKDRMSNPFGGIVITDLDEFIEEDETAEADSYPSPPPLPSAFVDSMTRDLPPLHSTANPATMALVLFKPPPRFCSPDQDGIQGNSRLNEENEMDRKVESLPISTPDDDAMDVELYPL